MDEDRKLYLEAAMLWLGSLGADHCAINGLRSMLPLGFAIGAGECPGEYVPEVAIKAAQTAREEAKKYRERQTAGLAEMNATEAMGQLGRGGLW